MWRYPKYQELSLQKLSNRYMYWGYITNYNLDMSKVTNEIPTAMIHISGMSDLARISTQILTPTTYLSGRLTSSWVVTRTNLQSRICSRATHSTSSCPSEHDDQVAHSSRQHHPSLHQTQSY